MLPEPKPRVLGRVSRQAEDYILSCDDEHFEALMAAFDAVERGDFKTIPIGESYLYSGAYSVLTTAGDFLVLSFRDDPSGDAYDVVFAGSLDAPPDVVDR